MPPATATSRSPARTAASIRPAARRPEAQTLLTVSDGTSLGMPAAICAWRDGIWPAPACSTWPITTCSTCSGATLGALERGADRDAAQLRRRAGRRAPPPSRPTGVRAAPRMTVGGMARTIASAALHGDPVHHPGPARDRRRHDRRRRLRGRGHRPRHRRRRARRAAGRRARRSARFRHLAHTHAAGRRWILRRARGARRASIPSARASPPRWRSAARASWARGRCAGSCPTT